MVFSDRQRIPKYIQFISAIPCNLFHSNLNTHTIRQNVNASRLEGSFFAQLGQSNNLGGG